MRPARLPLPVVKGGMGGGTGKRAGKGTKRQASGKLTKPECSAQLDKLAFGHRLQPEPCQWRGDRALRGRAGSQDGLQLRRQGRQAPAAPAPLRRIQQRLQLTLAQAPVLLCSAQVEHWTSSPEKWASAVPSGRRFVAIGTLPNAPASLAATQAQDSMYTSHFSLHLSKRQNRS